MKLFGAILLLFSGAVISLTAAYISIYGMVALFAAHAMTVAFMIGTIELGKLVAAGWLKIYWTDKSVSVFHKVYLCLAVSATMIITSLGVFGFLSAGHLEQSAPKADLQVQIQQLQSQVDQKTAENNRLSQRLSQIDQNIAVFLQNDRASQGLKASQSLNKERDKIQDKLEVNNDLINKLNERIAPYRLKDNEVEAKLGPIKYVTAFLGWTDDESAVRLVIFFIMISFDPLAIALLISAMITLREWSSERKTKIVQEPEIVQEPAKEKILVVNQTNPENNGVYLVEPEPEQEFDWSVWQTPEAEPEPEPKPEVDEEAERLSDREILISMLERNPDLLTEIEEIVEQDVERDLTDREKLLDLLEKNPSIINDMAELIASQITPKGESWLKD